MTVCIPILDRGERSALGSGRLAVWEQLNKGQFGPCSRTESSDLERNVPLPQTEQFSAKFSQYRKDVNSECVMWIQDKGYKIKQII